MRNLLNLPENLPVPQNDGTCDHLTGMTLPEISLESTQNRRVNIAQAAAKKVVFFFYPRTGRPEEPAPANWDLIPGARGCTPQSCGFRDLYSDFKNQGVEVFAVSSRSTEHHKEFASRMHIPFEILSDSQYLLTEALKLPTFEFNGMRLIKRLALYAEGGKIAKVFYPVFPPDKNASEVLKWLQSF